MSPSNHKRKSLSLKSSALSAWQTSALSAGAMKDHLKPNAILKPKSKAQSGSIFKRSRTSTIFRRTNLSQHTNTRNAKGTRTTPKCIFFWGGPLSNCNLGAHFSGQRALDILHSLLDKNSKGPSYPLTKRTATHMLATHTSDCGEQ
jgi:hypothetical protein